MTRLKALSLAALGCSLSLARAQDLTPPIQPKLSPVQTPPKVVLPPPPGTPVIKSPTISADDAARIALLHQPQIDIARAQLSVAHGQVLQAQQGLVPNFTASAGYSRLFALNGSTVSTGSSSISGYSSGISATQLLFDFNRTVDTVRQYAAQQRASSFALTKTQSDTVYTVKQDFYMFVEALRAIDADEANLKDRQDNLALAQARLNSGIGEPSDVVTAQTNEAAAIVALISARNTASTAQVTLAVAMGVDPRTPLVPADSEERPVTSNDVNGLVDQALKDRPDMKVQIETLRAAGYAVSVARKANLPSISLAGALATGGTTNPLFNEGGSFGISLTWTPLDLLSYRGGVDVAVGNRDSAKAQLQQTALSVVSDVSNAYLNVRLAEQSVATSQSEIANATEGLRIAEGQYKAGIATFVVVTDAETNLTQARSDLITSVAALQLARAAMEHALGASL